MGDNLSGGAGEWQRVGPAGMRGDPSSAARGGARRVIDHAAHRTVPLRALSRVAGAGYPSRAMVHPAPPASATPGDVVVETRALVRRYGRRRALDDVTLAVRAGECLALFGPNGAGKTTLLRSLAGLLRPSAGEARLLGQRLPGEPATRAQVGLLSHHSMLYDVLTVRENVAFAAALHGLDDTDAAIDAALARLALGDRAMTPVRALSRGWQQRTSIARAIVHRPALLLLDEPYTGLDVAGARALTTLLRTLRDDGTALVLVTHDVGEGLDLATHAAVLVDGRVVHHAPTAGEDAATFAARYRRLTLGEEAAA